MPQRRSNRLLFALICVILACIIGYNLYRRYAESQVWSSVQAKNDAAALQWYARSAMTGQSSEQQLKLFSQAVENNMPRLACAMMKRNPNLMTAMQSDTSSLLLIGVGSCPDAVKFLLENGNDANGRWRTDDTVLGRAAGSNNLALMRLLLEHGAKTETSKPTESPLLHAVGANHPAAAHLLLERGVRAQSKSVALQWAVSQNQQEMVRLLLEQGARPDIHAYEWQNTITIISTPEKAATRALLAKANISLIPDKRDVDLLNYAHQTALLVALQSGYGEQARRLIALGANVNAHDTRGHTPLLEAVRATPALVPLLIAKGANPIAEDDVGATPLKQAVMTDNVAMVQQLLTPHPDLNLRPLHGHTPLYLARKHSQAREIAGQEERKRRNAEVIRLLQQAGATREQ